MSRFREEQPQILTEKSAPLYRLAVRIADWVEHPDRTSSLGGWVAGVYGGRGTGKTSLLLTLLRVLQERRPVGTAQPQPPRCTLPPDNGKDRESALFRPAATRLHDDILFLLLDHLKGYGGGDLTKAAFEDAREAEVRRKNTKEFIEYAREMSSSMNDVPKRLVEVHEKVAKTTSTLRNSFAAIVDSLNAQAAQSLVLFVDDVDLQPNRALELLEAIHLFMNRKGVVVILAADKELLLSAVENELEQRNMKHAGLAGALLAKYVPHEWALPTPSEQEQIHLLWEQKDNVAAELPKWWPEDTSIGIADVFMRRKLRDDFQGIRSANDEASDARESREAVVRRDLTQFLPITYRGIAALHNRLASRHDAILEHGSAGSPKDEPGLFHAGLRHRYPMQINRRLHGPFLSILAAMDVRWPELDLWPSLERSPIELEKAFEELLQSEASTDKSPSARWLPPEQLPVLDTLLNALRLSGRELGRAKRLFLQAARIWRDWSGGSEGAEMRFLSVSLNGDAVAAAEPLWKSLFSKHEVEQWHLDLRSLVTGERASTRELREARKTARQLLANRHIKSFRGQVEMHAKAQLPLLLWLGWELRYINSIAAFNTFGETTTPFLGPREPLKYHAREQFALLHLENSDFETEYSELATNDIGGSSVEEAIVLVDLLGKSGKHQLDWFRGSDGRRIECRKRCRLYLPSRPRIAPFDLLHILEDVLELLGQLRDDNVHRVHFAFVGPDVVAFFLGQQLNAQGMRISLYELYTDHYEFVFDLEGEDA